MSEIFNFGAGPAMLPKEVMQRAREEFIDWNGSGMSVMEMSHRGKEFVSIAEQAEADLRELLAIPANYKVLFLQGGATSQFAMLPLNLLGDKQQADYLHTGYWSGNAIKEARRYCEVNVAATGEADNFCSVPAQENWQLSSDAAYVYYTANETISGVEFNSIPETGDIPLVSDMTSNLLEAPLDISKFGVVFAGAQKNIGPSGLVITIIREDLVGNVRAGTPGLYDYKNHVDNGSMYNTPATYPWYMAGLVFQWVRERGGLTAMQAMNQKKAAALYAAIDASDFYTNPIAIENRSIMNVTFTIGDEALESAFLKGADQRGLLALKGHRSVGGMRASIYNAMPMEGVQALIDYMREFEKAA
jgi:phosphoserine aminotransferase